MLDGEITKSDRPGTEAEKKAGVVETLREEFAKRGMEATDGFMVVLHRRDHSMRIELFTEEDSLGQLLHMSLFLKEILEQKCFAELRSFADEKGN